MPQCLFVHNNPDRVPLHPCLVHARKKVSLIQVGESAHGNFKKISTHVVLKMPVRYEDSYLCIQCSLSFIMENRLDIFNLTFRIHSEL